jgi:hypothetical protein
MLQSISQRTVVCEDKKPLRVVIEPSDGKESHALVGNQVKDRPSTLGISSRGDTLRRLVQQQVNLPGFMGDQGAIHTDLVSVRIDANSEIAHNGTVDGDSPLQDNLLGGAPGGNPGSGEHLL